MIGVTRAVGDTLEAKAKGVASTEWASERQLLRAQHMQQHMAVAAGPARVVYYNMRDGAVRLVRPLPLSNIPLHHTQSPEL